MALNLNSLLVEQVHPVLGLASIVPSTSTPDYVSMKNYARCTIMIWVKNATTVTGSAITVKQATAVAGTGEKALAFTSAYRNLDLDADDSTLASFAVTSNTFTTLTTNSKNALYIVDVKAEDLDVNNGFDCIRAGAADATAATLTVVYLLWGNRYSTMPSAIID